MRASELKEMTIEDLSAKLEELKGQYSEMKSRHFISPLENPLQIRSLRRDIARVKTEIQKKNS